MSKSPFTMRTLAAALLLSSIAVPVAASDYACYMQMPSGETIDLTSLCGQPLPQRMPARRPAPTAAPPALATAPLPSPVIEPVLATPTVSATYSPGLRAITITAYNPIPGQPTAAVRVPVVISYEVLLSSGQWGSRTATLSSGFQSFDGGQQTVQLPWSGDSGMAAVRVTGIQAAAVRR